MSLFGNWINKVNGVDVIDADDINNIAESVIENENKLSNIKNGYSIYIFDNFTGQERVYVVDTSAIHFFDARGFQIGDLLLDRQFSNLYRISGISGTQCAVDFICSLKEVTKAYVNSTFANALSKIVERENIIALTDVSPLVHDISLEMTADTDVKATLNIIGRNFLDPPWVSGDPYTENGVTFDMQDDNSIIITGTATANAYFKFETTKKLAHGTYTLKVFADNECVSSGIVVPTINKFDSSNKSTYVGSDTGNGFTFTVTEEDSEAYVYGLYFTVVESANYNFNGERFYAMLVYDDKAPTEYESYILYETVETKPSLTPITLSSRTPNMTIISETSGVTFKATYNRDLVKVVERIENFMESQTHNVINEVNENGISE